MKFPKILKMKFPLILILLIFNLECSLLLRADELHKNEAVILLHGLARTKRSMAALENKLEKSGYVALNIGYPSTKMPIERLADYVKNQLTHYHLEKYRRVHFVTHSMGGIVARVFLKQNKPDNLGRVVMISPPNHGSELADFVQKNDLLIELLGQAVEQLGTDSTSLPNHLGPVDFELGIIAGDKNLNPIFAAFFHSANDGKVAVESTKIEGMKDMLIVHESHWQILFSDEVVAQIKYFLANGVFLHRNES